MFLKKKKRESCGVSRRFIHVQGQKGERLGGRAGQRTDVLYQRARLVWKCCTLLTNALPQISLGDQANYYLSTASNELGVIMAISEAGNAMYPVSWKEYKDPDTGLSEARKVAKPY